jgi:hypothetical protein
MLIHADQIRGDADCIPGAAHIVLAINRLGEVEMRGFCFGTFDSSYGRQTDAQILQVALPNLLAELRLQIQQGRRATMAESEEIARSQRQRSSGSTVTE